MILIKDGHVVDPLTRKDGQYDVLIDGDKIIKVAEEIEEAADQVIDASGCYVMPGFIDLHVHFRDPGYEYKETLETGGKAAVRGGVTTVCAMPNTKPVIDTAEKVAEIHRRQRKESLTNVIQLGAVTKGQLGKELADIEGMAREGCHAVSEDGKSVMDASLYRKGMRLAKENGIAVFAHCEDINMVEGGVMNADENAERLRKIEKSVGVELDPLQMEAVAEAVRNGLMVITGGPGTGKTTTINIIIKYFELEGLDILLAAPTGRAAKRMSETTGYEARTIHRMLELNGGVEGNAGFERNEQNT